MDTTPGDPLTSSADTRALVTGASSGIGEAFARGLRARGRRLVVVARRADRLQKLAQELGGLDSVLALPLDLSAADAGERLQGELERRGIQVDLLVNSAGVGHTGAFLQEPPARIEAMIDLNVRAVVDLTRRFAPPMIARGGGALVNVVSTSAFQPVPTSPSTPRARRSSSRSRRRWPRSCAGPACGCRRSARGSPRVSSTRRRARTRCCSGKRAP